MERMEKIWQNFWRRKKKRKGQQQEEEEDENKENIEMGQQKHQEGGKEVHAHAGGKVQKTVTTVKTIGKSRIVIWRLGGRHP